MFGTTYEVSYKGQNNDRKAILDLVEWFGWEKSLVIFRFLRNTKKWWDSIDTAHQEDAKIVLFKSMNDCCIAMEVNGVSGEPVRALFRKYFGEALVKEWCAS